jgi:hypothetical protein
VSYEPTPSSFSALDHQSISESQNAAIKKGAIAGVEIRMVALAINNGWVRPAFSFKTLGELTPLPLCAS